jgi:hypothetical protein
MAVFMEAVKAMISAEPVTCRVIRELSPVLKERITSERSAPEE